MKALNFFACEVLDRYQPLREEIRTFLKDDPAIAHPHADAWVRYNSAFSRRMGARGFIGITWPKRYGGQDRTLLERYIITEELCAAGAPGGAHWGGDRQIGPLLLHFGTEEQRRNYLPRMARGEITFSLGMSEPDSGSDLASVRTRAVDTDKGWVINGRKIWTTNGHHAQYVLVLCRTGEGTRRNDLSQIIVPFDTPGVSLRPVHNMGGEHEFNETLFEDALVPHGNLVGTVGGGWNQVGSELTLERSGPERFLSSYVVLRALIDHWGHPITDANAILIGSLMAQLVTLRGMSISVAAGMQTASVGPVEAALVKDLGATFEQRVIDVALQALNEEPDPAALGTLSWLVADAALRAPSFSLRGGTREILRGIIARDLGLR